MSERNDKVAAMLAADAPAGRDLAFEIAVLTKIERRRFVRETARNLAVATGVALLLGLLMPQFDWAGAFAAGWNVGLAQLSSNTLLMAVLLIAASAAWYYRPRANA